MDRTIDRERERDRTNDTKRRRQREIERERARDSEPQPPFGPSIFSAIHESQQLTSPICFLSLKLPPPPCAVLLLYLELYYV